jgi:hypothetical protein
MSRFDPQILSALRRVKEVGIRTSHNPSKPVTIWIVVAGDDVFIRSFQGTQARWYQSVAADGLATLEIEGRQIPVHATSVSDPAAIERTSQAFLAKYAPSPYAKEMVRPEILPTTLLVEPR